MEKDSALYEAPSLLVFEKRHGDGAGAGTRPDDRAEHADLRLPAPFGVEVVIFFPGAIPLCSTKKTRSEGSFSDLFSCVPSMHTSLTGESPERARQREAHSQAQGCPPRGGI